jgi:hypothetical protein
MNNKPLHISDWSDEETNDPLVADHQNFYKVEKWTKDGTVIDRLLYAGNNLKGARYFCQSREAGRVSN